MTVLTSDCERPALRWFGGKWRLAPWILGYVPAHRRYTEVYGGGASVLIRKPRSYAEVYNDLDVEVVNLFRVLRDPALAPVLVQQLRMTPFAREEFVAAYEPCEEPVERARRLVVLSFMGFGSNAHAKRSTGFRSNTTRAGTTPASDWMNYPDALELVIGRMRGVVIENRPALTVLAAHDGTDTVHYVDPPYVWETRARCDNQRNYRHELDDDDHRELLDALQSLKGAVVLSGYAHPIYDEQLGAWKRIEKPTHADGARKRTEVLWLNPACVARLEAVGPLFAGGGIVVATVLQLRPVTIEESNRFIASFHRHNKPVVGARFCIGAALASSGELVGVAVVSRPVARKLQDGTTAEVTRCCVVETAPRGCCSFLYAACWRAWRAMGGVRLITYTLQSEGGASLRGAGWQVVVELAPNNPKAWQSRTAREWQPVVGQAKLRWEAPS